MATLIWITVCCACIFPAAILMQAGVQYFIFGDTKEEVIADIKDLLIG